MKIVLASGSPRRREILARIAYPFDVRPANLDESRLSGEAPHDYVSRLAGEKALAVAREAPDALVLGSDTAVVLGQDVLGKPVDRDDAARMLARLSGRTHQVVSGVAVVRGDRVERSFVTSTDVSFRALGDQEISSYVATDEPLDKAGAYAVQGEAGRFVRRIEGSVTGVIGLPFDETRAALQSLGAPDELGALPAEAIALRYRALRGEIAGRAVASGRCHDAVRLITVTKGHPASGMAAVLAAGATDVGENYVQEARAKRDELGEGGARWHLIGPLQRNKAGVAADIFHTVHTIDRLATARAIARRRAQSHPPVELFLQVNVARDPAKAGVTPEDAAALARDVAETDGVRLVGLMTIGRAAHQGDAAAATFAELRDLRDRLRGDRFEDLVELSMGMSGDYGAAIDEGATLIRLGTAILGKRAPRREATGE